MKREPIEPRFQGDEDYLCSLYAVLNGVLRLAPDLDQPAIIRLFRALCRALDRNDRLLTTLIDGGGGPTLELLLMACVETMGPTLPLSWDRLMLPPRQPFTTLRRLARADVSLLMTYRHTEGGHWTVIDRVGRTKLHLFDSMGYGPLLLADCGFSGTTPYRFSRRVYRLRRV
ncbi:hypothetical protein VZ95_13820 [Elstera litoralis]|uniref:Peptidase C39 domain-containing protein n=1 Tax=Elstera litoralis TaxID=552518 RepID=A0A0F3IR96_9PROT|nr:hypothetical protein [Elstera litoralis]KJV09063.1 hypothetical protein VZ95_13820 [Elstera litoralis]